MPLSKLFNLSPNFTIEDEIAKLNGMQNIYVRRHVYMLEEL